VFQLVEFQLVEFQLVEFQLVEFQLVVVQLVVEQPGLWTAWAEDQIRSSRQARLKILAEPMCNRQEVINLNLRPVR
jgi:hypothetical protein